MRPACSATAGLEKSFKEIPRDEDGNYMSMYNFGAFLQGQQMISVTDPELLKEVLTNVSDFPKFLQSYESIKVRALIVQYAR